MNVTTQNCFHVIDMFIWFEHLHNSNKYVYSNSQAGLQVETEQLLADTLTHTYWRSRGGLSNHLLAFKHIEESRANTYIMVETEQPPVQNK